MPYDSSSKIFPKFRSGERGRTVGAGKLRGGAVEAKFLSRGSHKYKGRVEE